jgi:hypothetical protein
VIELTVISYVQAGVLVVGMQQRMQQVCDGDQQNGEE